MLQAMVDDLMAVATQEIAFISFCPLAIQRCSSTNNFTLLLRWIEMVKLKCAYVLIKATAGTFATVFFN